MLENVLAFTISPLELVLRGTLMYVFLFVLFRFVIRRASGSIGISDFLFVVILGDAAQNAMIGDGTSTADGMLLILTLVCWNYLVDWASYRSPVVARWLMPRRVELVDEGKLNRRNMRRELVTTDELMAKIRESGIERIDQVKRAVLESDGEVSIIKYDS